MSLRRVSVSAAFCFKLHLKGDAWKWRVLLGKAAGGGGYGLYILAQTGFVKSGSDLQRLHASVGENIEIVWISKGDSFFKLLFVLFYGCSVSRGSNWDPFKFVKHKNPPAILLVHRKKTIIFMSRLSSLSCFWQSASCQCLSLAQARLRLSQRDLSLGAPPALCCAPLVEEVLVYCLHDLVKYVYMNDDQLV